VKAKLSTLFDTSTCDRWLRLSKKNRRKRRTNRYCLFSQKKFQNVYENFEDREERQKLPKRDYFSNKVA